MQVYIGRRVLWLPKLPKQVSENFVLTADSGTYTLTGTNATTNYSLTAESGSYLITGSAVAFAQILAANNGVYTLNGTDATLITGGNVTLAADSGVYTIFGTNAVLNYGLTADAGSYSHTGTTVTFVLGLNAESGVYSLNGTNAILDYKFPVNGGVYSLTGTDANFGRGIVAESGIYNLFGTDVTFSTTGEVAAVSKGGISGKPERKIRYVRDTEKEYLDKIFGDRKPAVKKILLDVLDQQSDFDRLAILRLVIFRKIIQEILEKARKSKITELDVQEVVSKHIAVSKRIRTNNELLIQLAIQLL